MHHAIQSYLISGRTSDTRLTEAFTLCTQRGIDPFDITRIERGETDSDDGKKKQSLGIDDVKRMQEKLYLKPLKGDQKAVMLLEADLLTIEAQNALLKVLEEPPVNTLILLLAETKDALLPTIRSRCTVIDLGHETPSLTAEEKQEFRRILQEVSSWEVGKKLKEAEKLAKNKDEALLTLEKLILVARDELLSQNTPTSQTGYYLELLRSLQQTHTTIKTTNANLRLTLENVLLQIYLP